MRTEDCRIAYGAAPNGLSAHGKGPCWINRYRSIRTAYVNPEDNALYFYEDVYPG
jgi:hypothetical protein